MGLGVVEGLTFELISGLSVFLGSVVFVGGIVGRIVGVFVGVFVSSNVAVGPSLFVGAGRTAAKAIVGAGMCVDALNALLRANKEISETVIRPLIAMTNLIEEERLFSI